jgi:hypothetical protein
MQSRDAAKTWGNGIKILEAYRQKLTIFFGGKFHRPMAESKAV